MVRIVYGDVADVKVEVKRHVDRTVAVGDNDEHGGVIGGHIRRVAIVDGVSLVLVPEASAEAVHLQPDVGLLSLFYSKGLIKCVSAYYDIVFACIGIAKVEGGWCHIVRGDSLL